MTDNEMADALIIGAGPTGAVAAKRLAEAGMRVVVLEQGDWPDYSKARADHADFELTAGRDWAANPNRRQAPADYPIDDADSDISAVLYNAVGGSTILYAAHWQRNMPSDFRVRTLDGVGDDWPLTYEELEPYYEQVETDFGISGLAGDPAFPAGKGPPLPPPPLARMGRRVAKAHNQLGWHWWPAPNAIATRPYRALKECTQRATCMWGCVEGAKASVDLTHWPHNLSLGVQLITGARVRRLNVNRRGLVTGATYTDRDGREHQQQADVTILGANGIGTPRLLQLSATDQFPDGLANSSGLVGRRLMMHPFGTVVGLFDEDLGSTHGVWGQHLHSLEFYETDTSRGFVRGAKWGLQPTGGPVSMTRAYPWGEENEIWGASFHDGIRKRLGRSAMWGIIAEDLPDENNRVVLDPDLKDSDGIPAPKLIYRMSENSDRLLEFHLERAKESLEAAGAYDTVIAPLIRETGWHLLGTCKMGTDPATSVVDAWVLARHSKSVHLRRQHLADIQRDESYGDDRRNVVEVCRPAGAATNKPGGSGMSFDQNERAMLAQLADVLIPAADGMPSASQADVGGRWLDAVLTARPDLAGGLKDVLAKARDKTADDAVTDLRANDPAAFGVLAEIVPSAYFMNPDVRQAIGYAGQKPTPIDPRPDYMEDGLLESVIRRGSVYRRTPDSVQ